MPTTRFPSSGGASAQSPPPGPTRMQTPSPQMQTPLDGDPLPLDADPLVMWPVMHARKPTPYGQTNTCENITLPQTSFAGGKYAFISDNSMRR